MRTTSESGREGSGAARPASARSAAAESAQVRPRVDAGRPARALRRLRTCSRRPAGCRAPRPPKIREVGGAPEWVTRVVDVVFPSTAKDAVPDTAWRTPLELSLPAAPGDEITRDRDQIGARSCPSRPRGRVRGPERERPEVKVGDVERPGSRRGRRGRPGTNTSSPGRLEPLGFEQRPSRRSCGKESCSTVSFP